MKGYPVNPNRTSAAIAVLLWAAAAAPADLRLPKVFTDHMVLQRELPIAVWGWADPREKVTVTLAGQSVSVTPGADSRWRANLPAMPADGKAHTLRVAAGEKTIELTDVWLGEVWLCSGQSNMARQTEVKDPLPPLRLFWIDGSTVPQKDDLGEQVAGWVSATPEGLAAAGTVLVRGKQTPRKTFTEVGYVFGRGLQQALKVPVGLIQSAFGGSTVEAWTPKADLEKQYPFGQEVKKGYVGHTPGLLYQSMIHGIVPLTIRGVIWYQGEDDGRNRKYHLDMQAWIQAWRGLWSRDDLPFYFVQIAPTGYAGGQMQYLWQSQVWVMDHVPHTALAVTNDMMSEGEPGRIKADPATGFPLLGGSNPHPDNKPVAAERLADIALVKTYRQADRVIIGPLYDSHEVKGDRIVVKFRHVGGGLATRDGRAPNWFEVSDGTRDRGRCVYAPAQAKIVAGDSVEVWSAAVKQPRFVRFAWNCLARHNLMNREGLPGVSFRTDQDP